MWSEVVVVNVAGCGENQPVAVATLGKMRPSVTQSVILVFRLCRKKKKGIWILKCP